MNLNEFLKNKTSVGSVWVFSFLFSFYSVIFRKTIYFFNKQKVFTIISESILITDYSRIRYKTVCIDRKLRAI